MARVYGGEVEVLEGGYAMSLSFPQAESLVEAGYLFREDAFYRTTGKVPDFPTSAEGYYAMFDWLIARIPSNVRM